MKTILWIIALVVVCYLGWYAYEVYTAPEATVVVEEVEAVAVPAEQPASNQSAN